MARIESNPPTMADIAVETGFSVSTVSRALRNDPRISAPTRKRVQAAAERLHFRPDPLISALVRRRAGHGTGGIGTIAFLSPHPEDYFRNHNRFQRDVYAGAREEANRQGYAFDYLCTRENGMTARKLSGIVRSRGIRGVCVSPLLAGRGHFNLEWEHFSPVAVGYSMVRPNPHRAAPHQFHGCLTLLRQLWKLGYRRPGLILPRDMELRTDEQWQAAALIFAMHRRVENPMEVLPVFNEETVRQWFERKRPDVVIAVNLDVLKWLRGWGLRIPEEIGFATMSWNPECPELSGLDQNPQAVGATAVKLCIGLIQRNETGLPVDPTVTLVEGRWVDGTTAPKRF